MSSSRITRRSIPLKKSRRISKTSQNQFKCSKMSKLKFSFLSRPRVDNWRFFLNFYDFYNFSYENTQKLKFFTKKESKLKKFVVFTFVSKKEQFDTKMIQRFLIFDLSNPFIVQKWFLSVHSDIISLTLLGFRTKMSKFSFDF